MSVALQAEGNPADRNDGSMLDGTETPTTLRVGYILAAVDERPRCCCGLKLSAESG